MKIYVLALMWFGLVAVVSAATSEEVIKSWAAAFTANDPAKLAEHYSSANPLLVMHWDGKVDRGHDAIVATGKKVFGEVEFLAMSPEKLVVNEGNGVATADFIFLALMSPKANDAKLKLTVRASMTLVKEGEEWKIVHEHLSPINGVAPVQKTE